MPKNLNKGEVKMEGVKAMEIFKLVRQENLLPTQIEDLMPLSFIGQSAVTFYRQKLKLMDQLKMTEEQRKVTLKDGQDAGEMLLDIETRIGEIALKEKKAEAPPVRLPNGRVTGKKPSGKPPKHERLGIKTEKRMQDSQTIAKNPEIVEKIKKKAIENEDIPTKTAVLAEIRYEKEKKRRKAAEGKSKKVKAIVAIEQTQYISALDKCLYILPQKPPEDWDESLLKEARTKVLLIMKRLGAFNG